MKRSLPVLLLVLALAGCARKDESAAMADFGANLSRGASIAITGVAYLIPWAFLLLLTAWLGRQLWRRWAKPRRGDA